jgi:hypothetical protein
MKTLLTVAVLAVAPLMLMAGGAAPPRKSPESRIDALEKEVRSMRDQIRRLMPEDDDEVLERLEKLLEKLDRKPKELPEPPWLPVEVKPTRRPRW